MKALPAALFIAALPAFFLFPLRFEIAGSILFTAGFAAIALCDYGRKARLIARPAPVAVMTTAKERFGLAA